MIAVQDQFRPLRLGFSGTANSVTSECSYCQHFRSAESPAEHRKLWPLSFSLAAVLFPALSARSRHATQHVVSSCPPRSSAACSRGSPHHTHPHHTHPHHTSPSHTITHIPITHIPITHHHTHPHHTPSHTSPSHTSPVPLQSSCLCGAVSAVSGSVWTQSFKQIRPALLS